MHTLDQIISALKPLNLEQLEGVAQKSGVPFRTLYAIRQGSVKNPRWKTVEMLRVALGI